MHTRGNLSLGRFCMWTLMGRASWQASQQVGRQALVLVRQFVPFNIPSIYRKCIIWNIYYKKNKISFSLQNMRDVHELNDWDEWINRWMSFPLSIPMCTYVCHQHKLYSFKNKSMHDVFHQSGLRFLFWNKLTSICY